MRLRFAIFGWALVLASIQCAPQGGAERKPAASPAVVVTQPSAQVVVLPPQIVVASREVKAADAEPESPLPFALPHFDAALRELDSKSRSRPVRIAWFGDSHTAADFFPGEVRRRLQSRFGFGGPGFIHVGNLQMRHDDVRVEVSGPWRFRPSAPAGYRPAADVRVGLGGMVSAVNSGGRVRIELPPLPGRVRWELVFDAPGGHTGFEVAAGDQTPFGVLVDGQAVRSLGVRERRSGLLSVSFETEAPNHRVQLKNFVGKTEFYGLFAESAEPAVVLDTLGINGARARTPLSWVPEVFEGELAEREPELVVLAYGTNEVGDRAPVETYRPYYEAILGRVHNAAPHADCLLVGPTDRLNSEGNSMARAGDIDRFQRELARSIGCGYFSLYSEMGGQGGFGTWAAQHPSMATHDGVHLTIRGYHKLGEGMAGTLLQGWEVADGPIAGAL